MEAVCARRKVKVTNNNQDELYRQARMEYDRRSRTDGWSEVENPTLFSAFRILQQLADENFGKAFFPLSILYESNRDVGENQDRAMQFAKKAFDWCSANQTNQDAELWCDLARMYNYGHGVGRNDELAAFWSYKAAAEGLVDGQYNLGLTYSRGLGNPQDYEVAAMWFRSAAKQGSVLAQLGLAYDSGKGVEKNYEKAAKWYRLAAAQGHVNAQALLDNILRIILLERLLAKYDEHEPWADAKAVIVKSVVH